MRGAPTGRGKPRIGAATQGYPEGNSRSGNAAGGCHNDLQPKEVRGTESIVVAKETIRIFIGIPLPEEVAKRLSEVGEIFKGVARPIAAANLHLTLRFLGNRPVGEVPKLEEVLGRIARKGEPFRMVVSGVGAFPSVRRARVVWVGIGPGADEAIALQERVEAKMRRMGYPPEERFHPHITVGRLKVPRDVSEQMEESEVISLEGCDIDVPEMVLFRSELIPGGARYSPLSVFKLGEGKEQSD